MTNLDNVDKRLDSLVSRIVRLEEEKRETSDAIKDVYIEAKSAGYNPKALRVIVRRRLESEEDRSKREVIEAEVELLEARLGDLAKMPLGRAAIDRVAAEAN